MAKRPPQEVTRLPLPDRLEPTVSSRTLMSSVKIHFYALYNATNSKFKEWLVAVGNKDAITGRRDFDRHEATIMIKSAAKTAADTVVMNAKDGDIYKCIVHLMRKNNLGLRVRRQEYQRITHTAPAE